MSKETVTCELCGEEFACMTSTHLRSAHDINMDDYRTAFPDAKLVSDGVRCRVSESLVGNTRALGYRHTDDAIRSISAALIGHEVSFETRQAIGDANRGHVHTEEAKHKMSAAHTGMKLSEETIQKLSKANKGRVFDEEFCRSVSRGRMGHTVSDKTRQKIAVGVSRTLKEMWKDSEFASMMAESWNRRPNFPELQLQSILDKHFPDEWKYTGSGSFWVEGKNPDFTNVNGRKQVIEMFGVYWHDSSLFPDRLNEEELIAHYKSFGFDCLVIWEYDVWDEMLVLKRIKELLGRR